MNELLEHHRPTLERLFPDLSIQSAVSNTDGLMNEVLIINGERVFRFAKGEEGHAALASEIKVLQHLGQALPVPIPQPLYSDADLLVYDFLAGQSVTRAALQAMSSTSQQVLAEQMAQTLRALHQMPLAPDLPRTSAPVQYSDWVRLAALIEERVYPLLWPHQKRWAQDLLGQMLADPSHFEYQACLIHGDLAPYHWLYDPATERLCGLLDFGTAGVGDPASDFATLLQSYGRAFVDRLLLTYPEAVAYLHRAQFYASAIELQWAYLGLTYQEEPFWFTAHLGNARPW